MADDEVEVVADDRVEPVGDDVIDVGHPAHVPHVVDRWTGRLPQWLAHPPRVPTFALVIGIAVGVGLAVLITGVPSSKVVTVTPSPSSSTEQAPNALNVGNPSLAALVTLAGSSAPLQDYPISDARPRCPSGTAQYPDPVKAVAAAVRDSLPDFALVDASRAVDLSGVCSVRVRERDSSGSVLVVAVDSPPNSGGIPLVLIANDGNATIVDVVAIADGWRIEAFASGVTGEQPQTTDLQNIVADPRMTW